MNDKIINKLGKIKAHMESAKAIGSEAEAQHFASMLHQMLIKHKLEMTDIEYDAEVKDEPVDRYRMETIWRDGKQYYKDYPDVEIKGKRAGWSEDLARIISRAHSCSFLVSPGSSFITFVGTKSNVAIVEYLFMTMYRTIVKLSQKEYDKAYYEVEKKVKNGDPDAEDARYALRGYQASWRSGFIRGLSELFEEERKQAETSSSTALLRLDKDKQAVKKFIAENYKGTADALGGGGSWSSKGYKDGQAKAKEVGIKRGVGSSGSSTKALGS